jgi:hypothetical protein
MDSKLSNSHRPFILGRAKSRLMSALESGEHFKCTQRSPEMNPHWDFALSLFAPLIETISGNNATASVNEGLEGR